MSPNIPLWGPQFTSCPNIHSVWTVDLLKVSFSQNLTGCSHASLKVIWRNKNVATQTSSCHGDSVSLLSIYYALHALSWHLHPWTLRSLIAEEGYSSLGEEETRWAKLVLWSSRTCLEDFLTKVLWNKTTPACLLFTVLVREVRAEDTATLPRH